MKVQSMRENGSTGGHPAMGRGGGGPRPPDAATSPGVLETGTVPGGTLRAPDDDGPRPERLAEAAEALRAATTVDEVAACLSRAGRAVLRARAAWLTLRSDGGAERPEIIGSPPATAAPGPDEDARLAAEVLLAGDARWTDSAAYLPLRAHGRTVGVLGVSWPAGRARATEDAVIAGALAHEVAHAVERARRHDRAERVRATAEDERRWATSVLDSVTDGVFAVDHRWCFTYVNRAAARLLGRAHDELLGEHVWHETTGLASGPFAEQLRWAAERGVAVAFEHHHTPTARWFEVRGYPTPEGLSVYLRDVTAQRQAEEALRASEERFRSLVEGARDHAIYLLDADGRVASWSPGAARLSGYATEDVLGRPLGLFHAAEDVGAGVPEALLRRAGEVGRSEWEGWRLRKDGTRYWARVAVSALRDDRGRLRGFANVTEDLTVRRRAEEERVRLLESERAARAAAERDRALFEGVLRAATEYSVIGTGPDGVVSVFNQGAERMLGYRADEVVGTLTPLAFHAAEEVAARADELGVAPGFGVFVAAARRGRAETREWTYLRKDGGRLPVSLTVTAMADAAGAPVGFIGIAEDVTARKGAEAERDALLGQLGAALRTRDQVLAGVAHDLRGALAAISSAADTVAVLAERPHADPAFLARVAAIVRATTDRMARWVDELRDASRLQLGQELPLDRTPVDLVALARAVAEEQQGLAPRHRLTVTSARPELVGAWDRARVERVIHNLVANALKYSPDGGDVAIEVAAEGDGWAVLRVRDDGIGIAAEEVPRLFELFHRGTGAAGGIPGAGIGLAIVRAAVERHGGSVSVESRVGSGSVFSVRLPLEPSSS